MLRLVLFAACLFGFAHAAEEEIAWQPGVWNGEKSLVSECSGWKAIVSLPRGRLVHFGPTGSKTNLLFAPQTRHDTAGWGGHRLWLGPQTDWRKFWPPPPAWEQSGADSFTTTGGILRLAMPDAGDGWPRLTRTYQWTGPRLICGAELSGGNRSVQIIHIVQVPGPALVQVSSQPEKQAALGYVQLPSTVTPRFTSDFLPPPHVTAHEKNLTLRHLSTIQKLGFVPQPIVARQQSFSLTVNRSEQSGLVASEPDHGFFTQVYLGGPEPFTELEQLSPSFTVGGSTSFAIELEGNTR